MYALRWLATASGSIMELAIMNLTSLRSAGTNGRIPSREWAMREEGKVTRRKDEV